MTDSGWTLLKYSTTALSVFYGVYATLTDFKTGHGDKKRLTPKGYFGIAVLMLSGCLGFISDWHKDQLDKAERKKHEAAEKVQEAAEKLQLDRSEDLVSKLGVALGDLQSSAKVEQNELSTSSAVLLESRRLSAPIGTFDDFSIALVIPFDSPLLSDYRKRLSAAGKGSFSLIRSGDALFPSGTARGERQLVNLLHVNNVIARFTNTDLRGRPEEMTLYGSCADAQVTLTTAADTSLTGVALLQWATNGGGPRLYKAIMHCKVGNLDRSSGLYSRYDLIGSHLRLEIDSLATNIPPSSLKAATLGFVYSDGRYDSFETTFKGKETGPADTTGPYIFECTLKGKNAPHLE